MFTENHCNKLDIENTYTTVFLKVLSGEFIKNIFNGVRLPGISMVKRNIAFMFGKIMFVKLIVDE